MYGVIIEKGPQNWQIIQQKNGFAEIELSGRVEIEEELLGCDNKAVLIKAFDENTNGRIVPPVFAEIKDKKWSGSITLPAGGPYTLEVVFKFNGNCQKKGDRRFHIGVGDIYVIAGQSNAVGVGKDCVNDPVSTDVHMYRLSGNWDIATHPLHDTTATIYPINEERTQTGHSPWINFAKILNRHLGYPIGLVPATKGGIPLSFWDRSEDGHFFDNMLEIIKDIGGQIKGILWSQGCNDTSSFETAMEYFDRFSRVAQDFKESLYDDIPILTVQLNKVVCIKDKDTENIGIRYAIVRQAQRKASMEIENVYMVPSIDLMVCDGIHNSAMSNMVIGERVANTALKYVYGKDIICDAPDIESAVLEDGKKVRLYFKNVYDVIFADIIETDKLMFSVTDEKGRILPIDYDCQGKTILLTFERDIEGDSVINCDGFNDTGLMPYDMYSYLPIVPFCDVEIKR